MTSLLTLYDQFSRWPLGPWLFSRAVCFKAPYFASISPLITRLESGRCEAVIQDRRKVRNHLGTVHAIALCNLAELTAGVMADASVPAGMRWIPKGMTVHYLKKARGAMRSVASLMTPLATSETGYDVPVQVEIFDPAGDRVLSGEIGMWLTPKR